MSRSVLLLSTVHQFQGPGFQAYVEDESYKLLVRSCIERPVDFVFEEAAGRGPSVAQALADSILGPGHYTDIDPSAKERPKFGIAERCEMSGPIDPWESQDSYSELILDEHKKREDLWLKRIQAEQAFEKSFVICGVAHSLSFSFRLQTAGLSVELLNYTPFDKLCRKEHARTR